MRRRIALKVIAVLEIIGGFGVLQVLVEFSRAGFPAARVVSSAIAIAVFLVATVAGVALLQDRRAGYAASIVVQLAQLFKVATPQFAFMIGFGGDLAVLSSTRHDAAGNQLSGLIVQPQAGPYSVIEFDRPAGARQAFGVSIVSCVALALLRRGKQPVADGELFPRGAPPAPAGEVQADGQPDWTPPFLLKVAVGLLVLIVVCCAGFIGLVR